MLGDNPLEKDKTCPGCHGSGIQTNNEGLRVRCPICHGSGTVRNGFGEDKDSDFGDTIDSLGSPEFETQLE